MSDRRATTKTYTEEEQDQLRERVQEVQDREGLTKQDIATQSGIKYGTLTTWLTGKYQGNTSRVATEVERWLSEREVRQATAASFVESPDFQVTPSAETFVNTMRYAQMMPDMCLIAGGAGIGKTSTAQHYQLIAPNVFIVTIEPSIAGAHAMLTEICLEVGVDEKRPNHLSRGIARKLRGSQALLIVDEAQHLPKTSIEQLRALHDKAGLGICLLGNETIYQAIDGAARTQGYAQLFSRFGKRITQARPAQGDIDSLIGAWGVNDAEEIKFLKAIARKPGALRVVDKTLRLASTIAAGADETRGLQHIRHAYRELGAQEIHVSS